MLSPGDGTLCEGGRRARSHGRAEYRGDPATL